VKLVNEERRSRIEYRPTTAACLQSDTNMISGKHCIAFGPVPSRRLGQSLGINNVTAKTCSYSCVYCQIGPTTGQIVEPGTFFSPQQIYASVASHLSKVRDKGIAVDYLTFVPDGEPTLDARLGDNIDAVRGLNIPVAVITNATLLSREDVRSRLNKADLVSVKVDCTDARAWRSINRPHHDLELKDILQGLQDFAAGYSGTLISDTMLIARINDGHEVLTATADFLATIAPQTAYLAVPTRPTTAPGIRGADEAGLIRAHEIFSARLPRVELLTGFETGAFATTGDARHDLLAITAVHPLRKSSVQQILEDNHADWNLVELLISDGTLRSVEYEGERYYIRPVRSG
jgi:wyosine [tRNA(Phe)-imidazoG37] synthetase (radical SAM superfamily)